MQAGLNAGFGTPLGRELLSGLANLGVDVIRQDVPATGDLTPIVEDFVGFPGFSIRPLFLLHEVARNEPLLDVALRFGSSWFDLEVFNEPGPQSNMDRVTFRQYVAGIAAVHHDCRARGFTGRILAGAPGNIEREGFAWLAEAMPMLPRDLVMAFHRYPYKTQDDRTRPAPPFSSRLAELDALHRIADGREIACTEFGYHTATEVKGALWWAKRFQMTDEQVREALVAELRLYASGGCAMACVYQLNDGPIDPATGQPDDFYRARFGIRRSDGTWKPAARCFREWRT